MYLYKKAIVLSILLYTISCTEDRKSPVTHSYFDIEGFFNTEVIRLNKANPSILKIVSHNNETEKLNVKIKDWKKELDLFISSDINKPSWRNSYNIKKNGSTTTYTALDSTLKIRNIKIQKSGKRIFHIRIEKEEANDIYTSEERLFYYPDSLYIIQKKQSVKVLGKNTYLITGKIMP